MTCSMPLSGEGAQSQDHPVPLDSKLVLAALGIRQARNAMRDQIDLVSRNVVDLAEQRSAVSAHDDETLR